MIKEFIGICSSSDEPTRQKLLCVKILCFMLIATDKSDLSDKEEMKDKIISLFGWRGYHDRMHPHEEFYGLRPEYTVDGFIKLSEKINPNDFNEYKKCLKEVLQLAKSTLGEEDEKTKKILEMLENF